MANILQKLTFQMGILSYHYTDTDIGSLKSLHTLFDKYLDHMLVNFEQNHTVWNTENFELFEKKKKGYHFWESVYPILEDVSVT